MPSSGTRFRPMPWLVHQTKKKRRPVPGFVGAQTPVTVCRTTHPGFRESMRLFGVPSNHPSRLENHEGVGGGHEWIITLAFARALRWSGAASASPSLGSWDTTFVMVAPPVSVHLPTYRRKVMPCDGMVINHCR